VVVHAQAMINEVAVEDAGEVGGEMLDAGDL
jgi:hypothetical protein